MKKGTILIVGADVHLASCISKLAEDSTVLVDTTDQFQEMDHTTIYNLTAPELRPEFVPPPTRAERRAAKRKLEKNKK